MLLRGTTEQEVPDRNGNEDQGERVGDGGKIQGERSKDGEENDVNVLCSYGNGRQGRPITAL